MAISRDSKGNIEGILEKELKKVGRVLSPAYGLANEPIRYLGQHQDYVYNFKEVVKKDGEKPDSDANSKLYYYQAIDLKLFDRHIQKSINKYDDNLKHFPFSPVPRNKESLGKYACSKIWNRGIKKGYIKNNYDDFHRFNWLLSEYLGKTNPIEILGIKFPQKCPLNDVLNYSGKIMIATRITPRRSVDIGKWHNNQKWKEPRMIDLTMGFATNFFIKAFENYAPKQMKKVRRRIIRDGYPKDDLSELNTDFKGENAIPIANAVHEHTKQPYSKMIPRILDDLTSEYECKDLDGFVPQLVRIAVSATYRQK